MQCPSCHNSVDDSKRFCPTCGTSLTSADASGPDPLIGQTLGGKYRVVRLLGEGGMGAVYEGEQQLGTAKRKVAVKTLHPHLSRDPKIQARFEREVGTIAELEHPNTIQVFDFGSTPEGILYIVMEFLHGKSLADTLLVDGPLAPERVAHILIQAAGSLEEAHGRGIIHRDLKPDNIVLVARAGQKDFVKVLDFGIAKRAKEEDKNEQKLTQQGMVLGTPPYMSPEQFTGRPIDSRSDIYSLGVVAYEMLTGKLPFNADTAWEWATQHMTQRPIPIESLAEGGRVPAPMRAAIERALAKAPEDRFATVREFADAFVSKTPVAPRVATVADVPAPVRQKTEMGAPLDVAAAFGVTGAAGAKGAPAFGGAGGGIGGPGALTPAGGNLNLNANVAFPTPAGIPAPPVREKSGGGRTLLLGAAGLIGIASLVAILFAVRGGGGGGASTNVVIDNGSIAAPATSLAPTKESVPTAPATDSTGAPLAPLTGAQTPGPNPARPRQVPGGAQPHPGGVPAGPHGEGPAAPPSPQPVPQAVPSPTPAAVPVPVAPPPATAPKYDGDDCRKARTLKALGHPKEAEQWVLPCLAHGGTP